MRRWHLKIWKFSGNILPPPHAASWLDEARRADMTTARDGAPGTERHIYIILSDIRWHKFRIFAFDKKRV